MEMEFALGDSALIPDLIIAGVLVAAAAIGAYKGLYEKLMPLLVLILSVICAVLVSQALTEPLSEKLVPVVTEKLTGEVTEKLLPKLDVAAIADSSVEEALSALEQVLPENLASLIRSTGISENAHEIARDTGQTVSDRVSRNIDQVLYTAIESLARSIVPHYVRLLLFVLTCILCLVVFTLIQNALGLAFRLPVIHSVDRLGGAVLGLAECAAVIWALLWFSRQLGITSLTELAERSRLLSLLM